MQKEGRGVRVKAKTRSSAKVAGWSKSRVTSWRAPDLELEQSLQELESDERR